ncbi:MAG: FtsW/RodA/SpoVE family cell cycle protein [Armatimonadetes bacterium]|nr:FtsW/RodA/SpoVE family cell cycle protein [Armatimonadota bacterium]
MTSLKGYIGAFPWPEPTKPLMHQVTFVTLLAIAAGLLAVESAAYPITSRPGGFLDAFAQFKSQLGIAAIAVALLIIVPPFSEAALGGILGAGLVASVLFMVIARVEGGNIQGNYSWTPPIGPLPPFQPSEIAKVCFAVVSAFWLGHQDPRTGKHAPLIGLYLLVALILAGLICWQRDLGMLMVFALLFLLLLFLSGLSLPRFLPAAMLVVLMGSGALMLRRDRLESWLRPMEHLDGAGYHIMNCKLAIARGAGLGLGIGQSPDKWYALPYPHTDSIFCVWAAETGLLGTGLLLGIFGAIGWFTYKTVCRAASRVHFLLAGGCGFLICVQAAVNMAVATNLIPPTGLTLPFISYGRSSLFSSALAMAVVLWVARRARPEPVPLRTEEPAALWP